jgi:chromosome segregation ATPase
VGKQRAESRKLLAEAERTQAEIEKVKAEANQINAVADKTASENWVLLVERQGKQLDGLDKKVKDLEKCLSEKDETIVAQNHQIDTLRSRVNELETGRAEDQELVKELRCEIEARDVEIAVLKERVMSLATELSQFRMEKEAAA